MKKLLLVILISGLLSGAGLYGMHVWRHMNATSDIVLVERGKFKKPKAVDFLAGKKGAVRFPGKLVKAEGVTPGPAPTGSWPRYRGDAIDAISADKIKLVDTFGKDGPPKVWEITLGKGYAGASVANGKLYILDYDEEKEADCLRCLTLDGAKEIWRRWYSLYMKYQHGYSRTNPTVANGFTATLGPMCHVMSLDSNTGEVFWHVDLVKDYGSEVPEWYASQCPLIDTIDGRQCVIVVPGGKALMWARDCKTGETVWETPNPKEWHMTHSSIIPVTFAGKKMYVYPTTGGVIGVEAATGKLLWDFNKWSVVPANVPVPLNVGDGRIFLSGGYQQGSLMLRLTESGGKISAEEVFRIGPKVFGSDQQTPILFERHIYGVLPKDAGSVKAQLTCLDLDGKTIWTSGSENQFGLGAYIIADGKLLLMDDDGVLTMAKATPNGYAQLAQAKVMKNGHHSWGPIAIAGGWLIVRNETRMVCLDMRADRGGKK